MTKPTTTDANDSLLLKTVKPSRLRLSSSNVAKIDHLVARAKGVSNKTLDSVLNAKDDARRKIAQAARASVALTKDRPAETFLIAAALGAVAALLVTSWLNRKD